MVSRRISPTLLKSWLGSAKQTESGTKQSTSPTTLLAEGRSLILLPGRDSGPISGFKDPRTVLTWLSFLEADVLAL